MTLIFLPDYDDGDNGGDDDDNDNDDDKQYRYHRSVTPIAFLFKNV